MTWTLTCTWTTTCGRRRQGSGQGQGKEQRGRGRRPMSRWGTGERHQGPLRRGEQHAAAQEEQGRGTRVERGWKDGECRVGCGRFGGLRFLRGCRCGLVSKCCRVAAAYSRVQGVHVEAVEETQDGECVVGTWRRMQRSRRGADNDSYAQAHDGDVG